MGHMMDSDFSGTRRTPLGWNLLYLMGVELIPLMSYSIVKFNENKLEILETFNSYDAADEKYDDWADKLPYAWIEIMKTAEVK